ncbi:MAG: OmpA family protein [Oceanospirillaceae bacterium]|nr:OmpA family protein [Oceanospirillaceae bacterium]
MRQREDLDDEEGGADAWLVTFADLMALLLAFFVLLYSFSKLDEKRFDEIANAFSTAFTLAPASGKASSNSDQIINPFPSSDPIPKPVPKQITLEELALMELKELGLLINGELATDIENGTLTVRREEKQIIIELRGDNSFASGSAEISDSILPTLERIAASLSKAQGMIIVAGHTDNQPILGGEFSSNWDLSAARAVSVAEYLMSFVRIDRRRFEVAGFADTKPLVANDSPENRALNRRVEIKLVPKLMGD